MKQLILLLASLLPIAGMAAEAGDTTIVVKGKKRRHSRLGYLVTLVKV